jgi:hypothetical protein
MVIVVSFRIKQQQQQEAEEDSSASDQQRAHYNISNEKAPIVPLPSAHQRAPAHHVLSVRRHGL